MYVIQKIHNTIQFQINQCAHDVGLNMDMRQSPTEHYVARLYTKYTCIYTEQT